MKNHILKWEKHLNRPLLNQDVLMASRHVKICCISYVTRKIEIKTVRYHCISNRMAIGQNTETLND